MDKEQLKRRTKSQARRKYDQPDLRVVVFKLAGHEYVVDVAGVQEIIRPSNLIEMAGAPEYVEGLTKRRGRIVPIVDLRKRLGLAVSPLTAETCVLIAKLPVGPVGFLVDSASELMWVKTQDFEVPSRVIAGIDQAYIQGVAHLDDRLLVMLDLELLLTPGEQEQLDELRSLPQEQAETLFNGHVDAGAREAEREQALRRLVAFELGDDVYGVPITQVAEIRETLAVTPLPNAADHVLGLANLRGVVLPVIDLRRRFQLPLKPEGPDNRLIVLKGSEYLVGVWVDAARGLERLPQASFQPAPPDVARIDQEYYEQVTTLDDGRILIELDVQRLVADTAAGREGTPEA